MRRAEKDTHLYLGSFPDSTECVVCGLSESNKRHNTKPVYVNPRTKRQEYTK